MTGAAREGLLARHPLGVGVGGHSKLLSPVQTLLLS